MRAACAGRLVVALLLCAAPARAHLPLTPQSLLSLLASADGVVVARALGATEKGPATEARPAARTSFRAVTPIAGETPAGAFRLQAPAPALGYAAGQSAIVLLRRPPARDGEQETLWWSPQTAGDGILIGGPDVAPATRHWLAALWRVAHSGEAGGDDAVRLLVRGLSLPERALRVRVAFELVRLQHDPAHFSPASIAALARRLREPGIDAELRPALEALLRSVTSAPSPVPER